MKRVIACILAAGLLAPPAWALEFAVVQSAAPTSATTQSFTSAGFGTPLCALSTVTYGTANGTVATHHMLAVGATDGTRSHSIGMAAENGLATSDTGNIVDTNSPIVTLLSSDQTKDGEASFDAWITDGVRYNWTDPPPSAYLVNTLLVGGSGVSNCYVGTFTSTATQDTATDVTAPGFQPDLVFVWGHYNTTTHARISFGWAVRGVGQRVYGQNDTNGVATTTPRAILLEGRVGVNPSVALPTGTIELSDWDASGFSAYLRDASVGAVDFGYMAIKFNGISATTLTADSPTSTGARSVTGAGFTPQFGMVLYGDAPTVDTSNSVENGEVMGIGMFTTAAQGSASVYTEDNTGTTTTESMTDTKPVRSRKDGADYMTASFTQFTSDGVDLSYATTPGSITKQAFLFVQTSAVAATGRNRFIGVLP